MSAEPIRFVPEIGLYAFSRGRSTCQWQTEWCSRFCYNDKFYRLKWKTAAGDVSDEKFWGTVTATDFAGRVHDLKVDRFRFSVVGEIWQIVDDVLKVCAITALCPHVLFWIPTRAWRDERMRELLRAIILPEPNVRLMLSIDPSITEKTEDDLRAEGFSLVFVGDNGDPRQLMLDGSDSRTLRYTKCLKTWRQLTGHCAKCETGCFSAERVDVHLRQHE